ERHAQLVMRLAALDGEIARAHAHHVGQGGEGGQEQKAPAARHTGACRSSIGRSATASRDLRTRRYRIRTRASTGTDKNVPAIPATSAPANTPNKTSNGWSSTPCPIRCGERI